MSGKRFTGCLLFLAVLTQQAQAGPACDGTTITVQGGTICAPRNNRPPTVEIKAPSIEDLGQQLRHEVADAQAARRASQESAERYAQELTVAADQSQKSAAALQQQLTAALADLAKARQAYEQQAASLAALQQRLDKGLDAVAGIRTVVDQRVAESVASHSKDWAQPVKELQAATSDRAAELEQRLTARQTTSESRLAALEAASRAHDTAVSSIGKLVDEKVGSALATGLSESAKRLSNLEATSGKLAQDAAASRDAAMNRFKAIDAALANQASALADQAAKLAGATAQLDRGLSEGLAPLQAIDQRLTKLEQTGTTRYDDEEGLRKQLAALDGRTDDNAKELQALRQSSSDQAARLTAVPGLVDQRIASELGTNQAGQGGEKLDKAPGDGRPGSRAPTIRATIQQLQQRMDQQDTASIKRDSANATQLADLAGQINKLQAAATATATLTVAAASQSPPSPATPIDIDFQQQLRAVLAEQARRLAAVEQKVEQGRVGQASPDAPAPGRVLTQSRAPQLAAASSLNCAALTPDNVGMWDTAVAKAYPGFRLVYMDIKAGNAWVGVPGGATQAAPLRYIAERAGCAG